MVFESMGRFMSKLMFFHGYVNEANGFPKPLSREDEEICIEKMMAGDTSAREKLINHNLRLVAHVAKKFNGAAEADDLIVAKKFKGAAEADYLSSVGSIGLIKAIDSFKPNKGSQLSTYASRCIENEILMLLRSNKKHKVCISIEETIGVDKDGAELTLRDILPQRDEDDPDKIVIHRVTIDEVTDRMSKLLDEREFKVVSLRYGLTDGVEHTQQEIAKMLDISRSYISRIEGKAIGILKEEYAKFNEL